MQIEGQQVQAGQKQREVLFAVAEVVFQMVDRGLEHVGAFIPDLHRERAAATSPTTFFSGEA